MTKCELLCFIWDKAAQSVKARLTPGCAGRRGNKGSIVLPQMFPGKLRRAIFAPFLGNSIYRAALQCLVFNSPPTISVTEGGIVVFSNQNWTPIPLSAWLRENTIQKLKILHKIDWFVNREEKKFPARKASWFDPGSPLHAMSLPPPFLSSYPTTCG